MPVTIVFKEAKPVLCEVTRMRVPPFLQQSLLSEPSCSWHGLKAMQRVLSRALTQAEGFICHSPAVLGTCGKTEIFLSAAEGRNCGCSAAKERIGVCLIWGTSQFALHHHWGSHPCCGQDELSMGAQWAARTFLAAMSPDHGELSLFLAWLKPLPIFALIWLWLPTPPSFLAVNFLIFFCKNVTGHAGFQAEPCWRPGN